jgi:hypothetical protein
MKKIITLLSVLLPLCTCAQVSFSFENGTAEGWVFSAQDHWAADGVSALNGKYSLHHVFDNTVAGEDVALFSLEGLCPDCSEIIWEFTVRHGAEPSSSNKWAFILASDSNYEEMMTDGVFNGFVAGVNFLGYDDSLRLWQITGGKAETVITSDVNWQNDVGVDGAAKVRVTRTATGLWKMEVEAWSPKQGEGSMQQGARGWEQGAWGEKEATGSRQGTAEEVKGYRQSAIVKGDRWKYAGISYTYTSTRDRLLWLDDVSVDGIFIADTLPPAIVSITAAAPDILRLQFDEEPESSSMAPSNISLTDRAVITNITRITPEVYELRLNTEIGNRVSKIMTFRVLCDNSENCASQVTKEFIPVYALTGDVAITEIMADPSPPVQLPDAEYIELTNLTADSLSLRDWILIADDDTAVFPDVGIRAGEHIILCSSSKISVFSGCGRVIGMTGFPSLNDGGEILALRNGRGGLIHAVTYSKLCYKDEWRSGGGWSMELTDMRNPFNAPDAWRASADPSGGTPGRPNSQVLIATDSRCPEVIAVYPVSPGRVRIVFDETVTGLFASDAWITDGINALSLTSDDIADRAFLITVAKPIVTGRIYTLQIPGLASDFAGNAPCHPEVEFGLPEPPLAGEILFNEILFDPLPTCADYLELYNNSDKVIDLSQLFLAGSESGVKGSDSVVKYPDQEETESDSSWKYSDFGGKESEPGRKSSEAAIAASELPRQLLPGALVALTTDKNAVTGTYFCSEKREVYEVRSLPSMPDDEGSVVLLDRALNILDRVDYSSSMHLDFLDNKEGIALEKVGPMLSSGFPTNWHSASEACGWGTPGAPNSVLVNEAPAGEGLNLSAARVSPDGDGFEDAVSVRVVPGGSDNVVTVTIFNSRGYPVRRLAERFFAGEEALIVWDGTGDDGRRLSAGLYLIVAESYNSRGQTWRRKEVCALLYR